MDECPTATTNGARGVAEGLAPKLAERREAARQSIVEAQARLQRIQAELARAAAEWHGQQAALEDRQRRAAEELADRQARLDEAELLRQREAADVSERQSEQAATLAERAALLNQREAELSEQLRGLATRDSALAEREGAYQERETELRSRLESRGQLDADLSRREAQLEEREAQLEQRAADLQRQQSELETQRRAASTARDAADNRLTEEVAELRRQLEQLAAERQQDEARFAAQQQAAREAAEQASLEIARLKSEAEGEVKQLAQKAAAAEAEARRLVDRVSAAEAETARLQEQSAKAPIVDETRVSDLEKRLQMAIDELRNERQRAAEMQKQLADVRVQAAHAGAGGAMDWEAQKRKLLQSLEEDSDAMADHEERLSIEETIRVTSRVVDEKEREIVELRQLLEQQSSNFGSVAVGAAALSDLVDNDELLQQERKKLADLQEEWQVKLRQAEIELSLERAKLGRERVELEERLRVVEQAEATRSRSPEAPPASGKKSSGGGRWLTRLGLRDGDG